MAVAADHEQQQLQQRFSLRVTAIGGGGAKTDLPVFEHEGAKYVAAENGTAFEVTIDDAAAPDSAAATPVITQLFIDGQEAEPGTYFHLVHKRHDNYSGPATYTGWLASGQLSAFVFTVAATREATPTAEDREASSGRISAMITPAVESYYRAEDVQRTRSLGGVQASASSASVPEKLSVKEGRSMLTGQGANVGGYDFDACVGDWRLDQSGGAPIELVLYYRDSAFLVRKGIAPPANRMQRAVAKVAREAGAGGGAAAAGASGGPRLSKNGGYIDDGAQADAAPADVIDLT